MTQGDSMQNGSQDQIDARFAEIVAEFDHGPAEPVQTPPVPATPLEIPTQWRMPTTDQDVVDILDQESPFVPPEPDPLPTDDPQFWTILCCLVGGPLWIGYLYFFDRYTSTMWWVLASGTFCVGLVLLFARQPHSRDRDPDDDGAVL